MKNVLSNGLLAVCCFLALVVTFFAQSPSGKNETQRIIRAAPTSETEILDEDDHKDPQIQITGIYIRDREIFFNKAFPADDNWLRDLRVRVRNISETNLSCVSVHFGLLAEIDTKLQTHESWPWGFLLQRGDCDDRQASRMSRGYWAGGRMRTHFRPGGEIVLGYSDLPRAYRASLAKTGKLAKAVLHTTSRIGFKKGEFLELPVALPDNIEFLDDDPY